MPYCTYASHKDARDLLGIEWITLSAIISTTGLCHHNNEYLPILEGRSWSWSYGSCSYNYLCNQCLSPLRLWVRILFRRGVLDTTLCVCQWLSTGRWFYPCTPVSSTNKTDHHDIKEISLKVTLNIIALTLPILSFVNLNFSRWTAHLINFSVVKYVS
jgi:hypothetical protein